MAVIEIVTFTATDDEALRVADARMQTEFAYQQPGMLRRTTARGDGGGWCVMTWWESAGAAANAETAAEADETASAFWALVDADSVRVQRFTALG